MAPLNVSNFSQKTWDEDPKIIHKSSASLSLFLDLFNLRSPRVAFGSLGPLATSEVTRPSHPCQLTWEVHASAEDDQKGRNSTVRRATETLEGLWMRVLHHVSRFQIFFYFGVVV
jgi:hypothetical protein